MVERVWDFGTSEDELEEYANEIIQFADELSSYVECKERYEDSLDMAEQKFPELEDNFEKSRFQTELESNVVALYSKFMEVFLTERRLKEIERDLEIRFSGPYEDEELESSADKIYDETLDLILSELSTLPENEMPPLRSASGYQGLNQLSESLQQAQKSIIDGQSTDYKLDLQEEILGYTIEDLFEMKRSFIDPEDFEF